MLSSIYSNIFLLIYYYIILLYISYYDMEEEIKRI
jgi:hypothetical protein